MDESVKPWYCIHDEKSIKGFFAEYRWLSNFYNANIWFEGVFYTSAEAAYQAAKVWPIERTYISQLSAAASKKAWKTCKRLDIDAAHWNARKYDVMSVIVFDKFYRNHELRQKLLETGNKELVESNNWNCTYWGVDVVKGGQNHLGRILMKIREYWSWK
jgi:ribA/ribD-fused uncharacterized protein